MGRARIVFVSRGSQDNPERFAGILCNQRSGNQFDTGLTDTNRQALLTNIEEGYRDLGKMAKRIADNVAGI